MIASIIASFSQAFGVIIDKVVLSRLKTPISKFIPLLFSLLAAFTLLVLPFDNWFRSEFFTFPVIGYLIAMLAVAFVWNILYYKSVQSEPIQEFEPILMMSPLVVILLAPIFYHEERNLVVFLISLVAGIILVLSHLEKGQIKFQKADSSLFFCIILMGFEVLLIRKVLDSIAPASLYFIRCLVLFLAFLIYYRSDFSRVKSTAVWAIVATSLLGVIQMVARFYSYAHFGLVYTTLILSASPVIVYLIGFTFLKEKILPKKLIGGALILILVIIASWYF